MNKKKNNNKKTKQKDSIKATMEIIKELKVNKMNLKQVKAKGQ